MDFGVRWKMGSVGGRDVTCNWDSFGAGTGLKGVWVIGCRLVGMVGFRVMGLW